jgi:membrane protease YdiL (CAAX protease family)
MLSEKPWRVEAVIQFCAGIFVCLCLGLTIGTLLQKAGVTGFKQPEDFGNVLVATLSFQGATWVMIGFFLWVHHVNWRTAFGFRGPRLKDALLLAVGFIIVVLPVVLLVQGASIHLLEKFGWPVEDQAAVQLLAGAKSWWMRGYLAVFAVVLAPVAEEFIFRGVLFPFIKQLGWPRLAWLGVSSLFALIHVNAATLVPLFVLALALTWLYEKTDNLLAPITAHALFNGVNLVVLFWQNKGVQ